MHLQQHLHFCHSVGAQFLCASLKSVDHTSPTIFSNVFSPSGNFSLSFWVFLPDVQALSSLVAGQSSSTTGKDKSNSSSESSPQMIHLLSRVHETGDVNLVSLLREGWVAPTANSSNFSSLTIHLCVEGDEVFLLIGITVTEHFPNSSRPGVVRHKKLKSKPLRTHKWVNCVVELTQDCTESLTSDSDAATATATATATTAPVGVGSTTYNAQQKASGKKMKLARTEQTHVAVFIDGELQNTLVAAGGKSPLHQNIIVGKIPTRVGGSENADEQLLVADIIWVPSSIYLQSSAPGYSAISSLLQAWGRNPPVNLATSQLEPAPAEVTPAAKPPNPASTMNEVGIPGLTLDGDDSTPKASEATSMGAARSGSGAAAAAVKIIKRDGYFEGMLSPCPPTQLLEGLEVAYSCAGKVLNLAASSIQFVTDPTISKAATEAGACSGNASGGRAGNGLTLANDSPFSSPLRMFARKGSKAEGGSSNSNSATPSGVVSNSAPSGGMNSEGLPSASQLAALCSFAQDILCLADTRAQEASFKCLHAIIQISTQLGTSSVGEGGGGGGGSGSASATGTPSGSRKSGSFTTHLPAGSALSAAAVAKSSNVTLKQTLIFCINLFDDLISERRNSALLYRTFPPLPALVHQSASSASPGAGAPAGNDDHRGEEGGTADPRSMWLNRLRFCRLSVERTVRVSDWGARVAVDENLFVTGVAGLITRAIELRLVDLSFLVNVAATSEFSGDSAHLNSAPALMPLQQQHQSKSLLVQSHDRDGLAPPASTAATAALAAGDSSYLAMALAGAGGGEATASFLLTAFICGGGWVPCVVTDRNVDSVPRRLFMFGDPRCFEHAAFPSTATVIHNSSAVSGSGSINRPCVWLRHCDGAFQRIDQQQAFLKPVFPRGRRAIIPSTEIISAHDPFRFIGLDTITGALDLFSLASAEDLVRILRRLVVDSKRKIIKHLGGGKGRADAPASFFKIASNVFDSAPNSPSQPEPGANGDSQASSKPSLTKGTAANAEEEEPNLDFLSLMQEMSYLRCLTVQFTTVAGATGAAGATSSTSGSEIPIICNDLQRLQAIVCKDLSKIVAIASLDPVQTVAAVFSTGSFKSVQLDVLKNLLKEGDIAFLEKISLRLWKHFKVDTHAATTAAASSGGETPLGIHRAGNGDRGAALIQLASLAGEVLIGDNKVRALSHFPSVRLLGVSLERMTGRWFYECTLLTDGLMQLGWANVLFRCDPVCGQGVGDHLHSWAFDGLRCKKWNVSCEPYGKRWRVGDTVGVLLDMDLMEMRFYLNGEDLGSAFEDFSVYDLFPAISLNVRQCARLNFGQYKFLHPPDEIDGKAYKPVLQFLVEKEAAVLSAVQAAVLGSDGKAASESLKSPVLSLKTQSVADPSKGESGERVEEDAAAANTTSATSTATNASGRASASASGVGASSSSRAAGATHSTSSATSASAVGVVAGGSESEPGTISYGRATATAGGLLEGGASEDISTQSAGTGAGADVVARDDELRFLQDSGMDDDEEAADKEEEEEVLYSPFTLLTVRLLNEYFAVPS